LYLAALRICRKSSLIQRTGHTIVVPMLHFPRHPNSLVQLLREAQEQHGWLPRPLLADLARELGLTLAQVEGVASFYRFFHLQPVGRWRVLFSDNITDRLLGSEALMADLCARLRVKPDVMREDGRVSVARSSCTGLCDQGPALLINHHHVITRLDAQRVARIAEFIESDTPASLWPAEWFRIDDNARHADLVFEGMTIAASVVGARQGLVYLRGEYHHLLEPLREALQRRRDAKLLGDAIQGHEGFDFDIDIHVGAGAYVCGEESSLIESLEGKRGTPRIRPPFPVEHGYLGRPTTVNNVETFCAAAHIALNGGAWWAGIGTPKSTGTKIHSVSGDCERPGLYEYPFGTRIGRILEDCGARDTQAVQVGGPSGLCVSAFEFGRRIAFEDVPTAGAFMVFDRSRDMFEVARNFAHFFAHESCGFCTPCRVGTALVVKRMDKLAAGHGSRHDVDVLYELDKLMHGATHCGLGASACNPLRDTIAKFRPAYERHLKSLYFEPAFDLDAELSVARTVSGRDDPASHLETAE
jgi:NADH:ubiquinone oxidoreductase subunit F (NADH-binding)/NADH:ubiquinone oxidoreductase subunit E